MRIHVVAVGRLRESALREACDRYVERIRRYLTLELHEVREAGRRAPTADQARRLEAGFLLQAAPADGRLVALTRRGTSNDSEQFAALVGRWREEARDVVFVVGGTYGLGSAALDRAEYRLSLGPMTLPHELARVVLLEQLYRACTILRGEPYHKGRGGGGSKGVR